MLGTLHSLDTSQFGNLISFNLFVEYFEIGKNTSWVACAVLCCA